MSSVNRVVSVLFLLFVSLPVLGQASRRGGTFYSYEDERWYVNHTALIEGGYQHMFMKSGDYNVATIHASLDYAAVSFRTGAAFGKDFIQVSPLALVAMVPTLFKSLAKSPDTNVSLFWMLVCFGASQWPIPLGDRFEITMGLDLLKLTWAKGDAASLFLMRSAKEDYELFLISGINAGLSFYITDNLFANAYYEYNRLWGTQNIHSCGVKLGWLFNRRLLSS